MPSGEDVTGLHAFDDLDPVSTVSALTEMPEPGFAPVPEAAFAPPRQQRAGSVPPPPPPLRAPGSAPGISAAQPPAARALPSMPPPPPRGGFGSARSVPPPPPAHQSQADDIEAVQAAGDEDSFEDTRVMSQADFDYAEVDADGDSQGGTLDSDVPPTSTAETSQGRAGIDDTELLELSATTVATKIDMEWDEEEVETKLRDDDESDFLPASSNATPAFGKPSPFPSATSSSTFPGNPSPFVPVLSSYPPPAVPTPEHDEWEDDEEARTRIMLAPSFPPPPSMPPAALRASAYPPPAPVYASELPARVAEQHQGWAASLRNNRMTYIGFGAVGLIAAAIVIRVLTAAPDFATVTLETKPADARVIIDGKTLIGQTSPFTLQGLDPATPHVIEVSKDGYAVQKQQFNVAEGEVKPLPGIDLAALHVDTGFAITSTPAGASVYVDGRRIDQVTPVRVADLSDGLHVVRLELAGGYQPWETQVALAKGQVIELPNARLVAGAQMAQRARVVDSAPQQAVVAHAAPVHRESSGSTSSRRSSSSSARSLSSSRVKEPSAPVQQQVAVAGGGSQGVLRVNSRPWSQVFVDGRMIGNTPQLNIPLPSGKHKVKLVNPQLGMSKGFDVGIQAGKATTKIVDLE